ncbi:hypothetical protein GCM10007858_28830 [Bradyrhizobium liaoningense]|nr:hypothetical protein GCM10007858_28830 [Bradyrhizobium liaoningense]
MLVNNNSIRASKPRRARDLVIGDITNPHQHQVGADTGTVAQHDSGNFSIVSFEGGNRFVELHVDASPQMRIEKKGRQDRRDRTLKQTAARFYDGDLLAQLCCGFRFIPAGYSDLKPAIVPI